MEAKLGEIYNQIGENVVETIPENWSKIFLYGEIVDGAQETYFFYYPLNKKEPVYSHDIPKLFNIDEQEYKTRLYRLLDYIEDLWNVFKEEGREPFSSLTMSLDHTGKFNIEYNYEDLSEADPYEQQVIWEYKYLGTIPQDGREKDFFDEYIKKNNKS